MSYDAAEQAWETETDRDVIYNSIGKHPYKVGFDRGYRAGVAASPSVELLAELEYWRADAARREELRQRRMRMRHAIRDTAARGEVTK